MGWVEMNWLRHEDGTRVNVMWGYGSIGYQRTKENRSQGDKTNGIHVRG